jgi:MFS family permease
MESIPIKRVFPVIALSVFAAMLGMGIITPLMPVYARDLGATGLWIGALLGGYSASRAIFMPFIGRLSDKHGRKFALGSGLLFYAFMSLFYMVVQEPWQLMLVRGIHGAAGGLVIPVAKAYVGELSPKGEEGTWQGYYNTAFFGGIGGGPLIGGLLYQSFTGLPPFLGMLDTGMVAAFGMMSLLNLLGGIAVFAFLPESLASGKGQPKPSFKSIWRSPLMRGILGLNAIEGLGRTGFLAFIPIYGSLTLGLSTSETGALLTTQVALSAVLQAPFGRLTDRFREKISRRMLVLIGGGVVVLFMAATPFAADFWQLMIISSVAGLTSAVTTPASSALTVGEGRRHGMASVMALTSVAISIGQAGGPILGGVVQQFAGDTGPVFFFCALMVALGIGLFGWFTRHEDTTNLARAARHPAGPAAGEPARPGVV